MSHATAGLSTRPSARADSPVGVVGDLAVRAELPLVAAHRRELKELLVERFSP
ncbi:MAG: hypothetical protein ACRDUB_03740 [Mycobacterium sp.]